MTRHLGLTREAPDPKRLRLANYLDKGVLIDVEQAPMGADWTMIPLPSGQRPSPDTDPLYNRKAGCCVFSMAGHYVKLVARHVGRDDIADAVTEEAVKRAYIAATGYNPDTGENDTGYTFSGLWKIWETDGLFGTKVLARASVDWLDEDEVALGDWLGVGTLGGYALPLAAQTQVDELGRPDWRVPPEGWSHGDGPGKWGNHAILQHGQRGGNTWGESVIWTQNWARACCFDLHFVVLDIAKIATGRAPNGFAFDDLLADTRARAAGRRMEEGT
jgi:hypothetical protein